MLERVAQGLQDLSHRVVFVGGATTVLYTDDPAIGHIRSTNDVDCTIEISSYLAYTRLEEKLRRLHFAHVVSEDAPVCRWSFENIVVDVMPDDESILGFSNSWYKSGRKNKEAIALPNGTSIFIFPVEYFLASKIEAFNKRGKHDYFGSKDMEDIVTVLDGILTLESILARKNKASSFLRQSLSEYAKNEDFLQSLAGHIENGVEERAIRIRDFLQSVSN